MSADRGYEEPFYDVMPAADLDLLPAGTIRDWELGGVYVKAEKSMNGKWRLFRRRDIPSSALGRLRSTAYVPAMSHTTKGSDSL